MTATQVTIQTLRGLQWRRCGYRLGLLDEAPTYTTDPAWLVNMAINRRAGWPDDPSLSRGSAMPVEGKYPKRAIGDCGDGLETQRLARHLNGARTQTDYARTRCLPKRLRIRLAKRVKCRHADEWIGGTMAHCEECLVDWWMADYVPKRSAAIYRETAKQGA